MARPWRALRERRARALFATGRMREQAGDDEAARRSFERVLALAPAAPAWSALGDVCFRQRDYGKAEICYRTALEDDASAPSHLRLSRALREIGRLDEAIGQARQARELDPSPATLRELIGLLLQADNVRKARELAEAAAAAAPASYDAQLLLGMVCQKAHEPLAALACYEAAVRLRDDDPELYDLRGSARQELGRMDDALADYERALVLQPGHPSASFHLGMARLLLGDFARGWAGYELRKLNSPGRPANNVARCWDGAPLAGRTLLVRREQGLGDEIMFASLLGELAGEAGHCIVECDARLLRLFARSFPAITFFASLPDGSLPKPIAARRIDLEVPAGSVPSLRRRHVSEFPSHGGYLRADPARVAHWRARLEALGPGMTVGVSWTGGVRKTRRGLRSLALAQWRPLFDLPAVHFVSLQYTGEAEREVEALRLEQDIAVHHWPEAIEDYDETAALVCALGLVVSVCTSVVHLAGALNRPAWVLAPYSPEWRYGFTGESMPWYPSVRVLRQRAFGEWQPLVERAAEELRSRVSTGAAA
jgi:Flp pilus assembly protein TadD